MSQEVQVVQCYACRTFQSQIVKKSTKWECKMCGEKQSIKKVFGQGSGKDCRIHLQRLNELWKKKGVESLIPDECDVPHEVSCSQTGKQGTSKPPQADSKWAKYLTQGGENNSDSDGEQDVRWSQIAPHIQSSPVAFELPHTKKQKMDPFLQEEDSIKIDTCVSFDLDFIDDESFIQAEKEGNAIVTQNTGTSSLSSDDMSQQYTKNSKFELKEKSNLSLLNKQRIESELVNLNMEYCKTSNGEIQNSLKDVKNKSNEKIKRSLSLFENLDEYTEEEIDNMFSF